MLKSETTMSIDIKSFTNDERLLQELANGIFKNELSAAPAVPASGHFDSLAGYATESPLNAAPYAPGGTNPTSGRSGKVSSSSHHQNNEVDLKQPQTALYDPHF